MSMLEYALSNNWQEYNRKSNSTTSLNEEPATSVSYSNVPRVTNLSVNMCDSKWKDGAGKVGIGADAKDDEIVVSSDTVSSTQTQETETWVKTFNDKLCNVPDHPGIFRITTVEEFTQLFHFYYGNGSLSSDECFPYLHGLNNVRQRIFFSDDFNTDDIDHLSYHEEVSMPPALKNNFHLMFLNTKEDSRQLINSCNSQDVFTPKYMSDDDDNDDNDGDTHVEYVQYEMLDHINQLSPIFHELNNRNYSQQIKLMAPLSNFVVYNDSMDYTTNLNCALTINKLTSDKFVYIVDIPLPHWQSLNPEYFNRVDSDLLYRTEQNMLGDLNYMKNPFPNIYTGTIKHLQKAYNHDHDFKLFINCHKDASFPQLSGLENHHIHSDHENPIYFEFPSSGSLDSSAITLDQILSFLNVLKLIHHYVKIHNFKVYIFSFDGFTELSLLTLALGCMWGVDGQAGFIEEAILQQMNHESDLRLYFFRSDLVFLKKFERMIIWMKELKLEDEKTIDALDYEQMNYYYDMHIEKSPSISYDWFNFEEDNNFPSKILSNLYLGSLNHASSDTVLRNLGITKIVSVGETPLWLGLLDVVFEHDIGEVDSKDKRIIKPIYSFNNGVGKIYEIKDINKPNNTTLNSVIYIHNLKDDGKDSMFSLLMSCPSEIQSKFIIDPQEENRTLVHCRIGVSRSATLTIASVMKHQNMSLVEAYMYVRVRRFNIIIQPNLRLFYELYCYEEYLNRGSKTQSWSNICNEIFKLNNHYFAS